MTVTKTSSSMFRAFAPATVANAACGFDILGFAIEGWGDYVSIEPHTQNEIQVSGPYGSLIPTVWEKNTAAVAMQSLLHAFHREQECFRIHIEKNMPLGSGMGSSASSAAAAVLALNSYLGQPCTRTELVPYAMAGEAVASGSMHADNVAPALLGGWVLIRSYEPLDVLALPYPQDMQVVVVHPHIELKTYDARRILRKEIDLHTAISQVADMAGFILALQQGDYELMQRSMQERFAEPYRKQLIPGMDAVKAAAMQAGAIGCGISGSGPSLFALCKNQQIQQLVGTAMLETFNACGLQADLILSGINPYGSILTESHP